jgi:hypothetical protein
MFFISSALTNMVITVQDNSRIPGAVLVMDKPNPELHVNQLWFKNDWGLIVSVMTNFILGAEFGSKCHLFELNFKHECWALDPCALKYGSRV